MIIVDNDSASTTRSEMRGRYRFDMQLAIVAIHIFKFVLFLSIIAEGVGLAVYVPLNLNIITVTAAVIIFAITIAPLIILNGLGALLQHTLDNEPQQVEPEIVPLVPVTISKPVTKRAPKPQTPDSADQTPFPPSPGMKIYE